MAITYGFHFPDQIDKIINNRFHSLFMPIHIWRRLFKSEVKLAEKAETRKAYFLTAEDAWKADSRRIVESYANSDLLQVSKTRAFDRWL